MIKLTDQNISQASLDYLAKHQALIDAKTVYAERVETAKAKWGNFQNKAFREIKTQLIAMSYNPNTQRCVYCEDNFADEIEHFRPKDLYPEQTFVWENYLLACGRCNGSSKHYHFAVFDAVGNFQDISRPPKTSVQEPITGDAVLINPRYEDPMDFLRLDILSGGFEIQVRPQLNERDKRRATYTIELLQLNKRSELTQGRKTAFESFMDWLWAYKRLRDNKASTTSLQAHREALAYKSHIMVWEEIRRFYIQRPSHWETALKPKYSIVADLDMLFTAYPELLTISFIP